MKRIVELIKTYKNQIATYGAIISALLGGIYIDSDDLQLRTTETYYYEVGFNYMSEPDTVEFGWKPFEIQTLALYRTTMVALPPTQDLRGSITKHLEENVLSEKEVLINVDRINRLARQPQREEPEERAKESVGEYKDKPDVSLPTTEVTDKKKLGDDN